MLSEHKRGRNVEFELNQPLEGRLRCRYCSVGAQQAARVAWLVELPCKCYGGRGFESYTWPTYSHGYSNIYVKF